MKDSLGNIITKKTSSPAVTVMLRSSSATTDPDARVWASFLLKELPDFRVGDSVTYENKELRIVDRCWQVEDDVTLILSVSPQL